MLGTFGRYGVLSFNGNKMITTSGGGALICPTPEAKQEIMWYATQAREAYPYYQHEAIGYNYRMSNICAGIGRGQMSIAEEHVKHHQHIQRLYEEAFKDAIRCSICTGEEVAGFQELETGRFHEERLLQSSADLEDFKQEYGIDTVKRIY